jgi:hypothetical protein
MGLRATSPAAAAILIWATARLAAAESCNFPPNGTGFNLSDANRTMTAGVGAIYDLRWYTENACAACPGFSELYRIAFPLAGNQAACQRQLMAVSTSFNSKGQRSFWQTLSLEDRYNASKKVIQDVLNTLGISSFQRNGRFPSLAGLEKSDHGVDVLYRALPCIYGLETANTFDPNLLGTCSDPNSTASGIGQVLKSTFELYWQYPWLQQFATAYLEGGFPEQVFEEMPRNPKLQVAASIAVFLDSMAGRRLTTEDPATAKAIFARYGDGTSVYGEAAYACFACMQQPAQAKDREIGCLKRGPALREALLKSKKRTPNRKGRR